MVSFSGRRVQVVLCALAVSQVNPNDDSDACFGSSDISFCLSTKSLSEITTISIACC